MGWSSLSLKGETIKKRSRVIKIFFVCYICLLQRFKKPRKRIKEGVRRKEKFVNFDLFLFNVFFEWLSKTYGY